MNNEKDAVLKTLDELNEMIKSNIREDGTCAFDMIKAQVVLDFAKAEISKSIKK